MLINYLCNFLIRHFILILWCNLQWVKNRDGNVFNYLHFHRKDIHIEKFTGSRSTFEFPSRVNLSGPSSMDRRSRCNKVDAVRPYASYRFNLLLLKGQRWCVNFNDNDIKDIFTLKAVLIKAFK